MKAWYTVQTLIKSLEKFNPNAEVLIGVEDDNLFDSDVIKGFATGIDKIDYDHDDFMKCIFVTESIPYDLKYFLQDIGIIEVLQVVEKVETETYNIWLPSNTDDEPPF